MAWIEIIKKIAEITFASLATLGAAYFGAKYAFKLQNDKDKRTSEATDVKSANGVIFELARTLNKFIVIKRQFIDEHRDRTDRHLTIMPVAGMSWETPKFNYDALSFLFRASDPNLLGTLSLLEQEIASILDVIQQRSMMHVELLQPTVESISRKVGEKVSRQEIEDALGPRLAKRLQMSTTVMVDGIDSVLAGCREHIEKIKNETQKLYPGHSIIGIVTPPDAKSKNAAAG